MYFYHIITQVRIRPALNNPSIMFSFDFIVSKTLYGRCVYKVVICTTVLLILIIKLYSYSKELYLGMLFNNYKN